MNEMREENVVRCVAAAVACLWMFATTGNALLSVVVPAAYLSATWRE